MSTTLPTMRDLELAPRILSSTGQTSQGRTVEAGDHPEAVSLEPTACLSSLPLELVEHVAIWLHSLTDLAQMQCVDRQCRDGSSARAAQLSQLLGRFPRLKHILRHAARENLCPRPLDLDAILAQQQAADVGQQRVAGLLQELPHAEQLDPALLLTVEMRYLAEFALWSGSPKHAFDERNLMGAQNVMGPTYRPRLWKERPKWINELKDTDQEAANRGWARAAGHVRVFLTRGVHTVKVLDGIDGQCQNGEHTQTYWQDADGSRDTICWESEHFPFAYVGRDMKTFEFTFRMSDDGYFELDFMGNVTPTFSWSNVCGIFNVWPFTTTTEVEAVKGPGWCWDDY